MEEKLVSEYIGKDAEKFMEGKVNWTAAILGQAFGPVWFFFRKSYLLGFAFLVITFIVGAIASAIELDKSYYIMFFIYLFTANKLYLWDVRRKVNKMMSSGASEEELISTAKEKGGTSTVAAVIYMIAFIAYIAISYVVIYSAAKSILMLM